MFTRLFFVTAVVATVLTTAVLAILLCLGVMTPFGFIGLIGVFGIVLSSLFVFEAGAVFTGLAFMMSKPGINVLINALTLFKQYRFKPFCYVVGLIILAVLCATMVPSNILMLTSFLPLFAGSVVVASLVVILATVALYTVAFLIVERIIANVVLLGFNYGGRQILATPIAEEPSTKVEDPSNSVLIFFRSLGVDAVALATGESHEHIAAGEKQSYRICPAFLTKEAEAFVPTTDMIRS